MTDKIHEIAIRGEAIGRAFQEMNRRLTLGTNEFEKLGALIDEMTQLVANALIELENANKTSTDD